MGLGTLHARDFQGPDYQFLDAEVEEQDALLSGHVQSIQIQPDVWLHGVEARDLRTLHTTTPAEPGVHVVVLLEGSVDVAFGGQALQMQVPSEAGVQACGAIIHSRPGDLFERHWRCGKYERKLSLSVAPQQLVALGLADQSTPALLRDWMETQQLAIQAWQPSPRAIAVTEQIIQLAREGSAPLLLLSRTLELLHEALQSLAGAAPDNAASAMLGMREHQRMARLKSLLDSNDPPLQPLGQLARDVGLSPSALQRQFKQLYGSTIDDYRRDRRLERAWSQLEQTGCSVAEVAHCAGYTSAANFATAFKRRFGISPKLVRARI
ncbi:AraC family transcriptional regulator [Pantoea sp. 18069]|uniref:helix-turn-helix transcriptional regulator n=1 Tax=Pantoea sp. 18069 TaxID=2681415 RepID=UPI00190FB24A|nr:AraC family transcriptional regulator [Pantoea sp. 18069]